MILAIWCIYIIFKGELEVAPHYGVKGNPARIAGVLGLLLSLGVVPYLFNIQDVFIGLFVTLALLIIIFVGTVMISGNDLKEVTTKK